MAKIILCCLLLAGCGTFPLARSVTPPPNKSVSDVRLDILDCKDRARTYAESADKQVRAFVLGFTIIGVPVAYAAERADQREAFRECMERSGYSVTEIR